MGRPRQKGDGRGNLGGGRAPGTPNKSTREIRAILTPILTAYIDGEEGIGKAKAKLSTDLEMMEPEDRAKTVIALLPFIAPKMSSVEIKDALARKSLKDELDELCQEQGAG